MLITIKPNAPPPSVATFNASYVDFSAAAVDLTFELVAEYIAMYAAKSEKATPRRKLNAISPP